MLRMLQTDLAGHKQYDVCVSFHVGMNITTRIIYIFDWHACNLGRLLLRAPCTVNVLTTVHAKSNMYVIHCTGYLTTLVMTSEHLEQCMICNDQVTVSSHYLMVR